MGRELYPEDEEDDSVEESCWKGGGFRGEGFVEAEAVASFKKDIFIM